LPHHRAPSEHGLREPKSARRESRASLPNRCPRERCSGDVAWSCLGDRPATNAASVGPTSATLCSQSSMPVIVAIGRRSARLRCPPRAPSTASLTRRTQTSIAANRTRGHRKPTIRPQRSLVRTTYRPFSGGSIGRSPMSPSVATARCTATTLSRETTKQASAKDQRAPPLPARALKCERGSDLRAQGSRARRSRARTRGPVRA
jgi:hypothetical protein